MGIHTEWVGACVESLKLTRTAPPSTNSSPPPPTSPVTLASHRPSLRPAAPSLLARRDGGGAPSTSAAVTPSCTPLLATRLTLATADPAEAAAALGPGSPAAGRYTILALRPLSDRVLAQACSGSLAIDIIAVDWGGGWGGRGSGSGGSAPLPHPPRLRPAAAKAAVGKGIAFEVSYAHLLSRDDRVRKAAMAGAAGLARATRGAGIVLSSGGGGGGGGGGAAQTFPCFLRAPRDAAALLAVGAGLGRGAALAAVSSRPAALLERGRRRVAAQAEVAAGGGGR